MNITYKDFNDVCRLCLTKVNFITCVLQENILKMLDQLGAYIKVKAVDELPQKICDQCQKRIENTVTFISQCKRSYAILNSILLQEKNNTKECYDKLDIEIATKNQDTGKAADNDLSLNIINKYLSHNTTKEFVKLSDKREHENIYTGETPYKCPYCLKEFKLKTNLRRHTYRHRRKLGLIENKTCYIEKRVRLKLKCEKCEKVFGSRSGYQHHKLKHDGKVLPKKNGVKRDKHTKHFLCNYCAMGFNIKTNLDAHLRVHTGEKPYKCNHCDQQFKQKSVLDRHTLNHLDVRPKPFVCNVCQKCFTTKAHMEIHKRLHTGEKPYECHFCQKRFNYKTRWRIHLRIHTGESPYVCSICANSYHDKGSLKKHQRKKGHNSKDDCKNLLHTESDAHK